MTEIKSRYLNLINQVQKLRRLQKEYIQHRAGNTLIRLKRLQAEVDKQLQDDKEFLQSYQQDLFS